MAGAGAALPVLRTGWYWWDFGGDESAAWAAFQRAHRESLRTTTTWTIEQRAIVLFEVRAPLRWSLAGKPQRAPKGPRTGIADMAQARAPSAGFVVAAEQLLGKSYDQIRRAGRGGVGGLLLWGGAIGLAAWGLLGSGDEPPAKGKGDKA